MHQASRTPHKLYNWSNTFPFRPRIAWEYHRGGLAQHHNAPLFVCWIRSELVSNKRNEDSSFPNKNQEQSTLSKLPNASSVLVIKGKVQSRCNTTKYPLVPPKGLKDVWVSFMHSSFFFNVYSITHTIGTSTLFPDSKKLIEYNFLWNHCHITHCTWHIYWTVK
jgi:hypothetical protein